MTDHPDRQARSPESQWWVIRGQDLLDALNAAHDGAYPDVVYLELLANSEVTEP